ncbi:MAG: redox-sensitive transcriptional activator SoxR [Burkholderiales bacterium]|nr:redox-sensitive transcriptional activator SoxR [Burkholderiales bacterium]
MASSLIPIGTLSKRSGVPASTLRFYEDAGLIRSTRAPGQRRHYPKEMLRRVAFIRVAQSVGLSLEEIHTALAGLPNERTPNCDDWEVISASWRPLLQARIDALCRLRDKLDGCIGCGCLSLDRCQLYNRDDEAAKEGCGPRFLLHESPAQT